MIRLICILLLLAMPAAAKPNVVLILADDFSMNLMPKPGDGIKNMPALAKMQREGMTLTNFITVNSLCCPSRASILTGMLPHNTHVETNTRPEGGLFAFSAAGNEVKTFAPLLKSAGYRTAFLGKYLNGWGPGFAIPPGWDYFASTNHGYTGFGYTLDVNGVQSTPADHFTDVIAELARAWISSEPFFLEMTPFSVHSPYTPPARYASSFLTGSIPKTPAWDARPDAAAPAWLQIIPPLRDTTKVDLEAKYVMRLQGSAGIDDAIQKVRARISAMGLAGQTYVIFTADNGYHMGEMSLRAGKMTPFDFDSNVPFVIVGPGIAPGSASDELTMNIDIAPTLLDLAGVPIPATMDGRSMVPVFAGSTNGRTMAVIEHLQTVMDPDDPDYAEPKAGDPPTYTALRGKGWLYAEYATGEATYYDMTTDPYQLHNIAASLTPTRLAELHTAAVANATCAGAVQCGAAQDR